MKNTTISFDEAQRKLPTCCYGAWENLREDSGENRIEDLIDAAKHELELFYEQQDGCITRRQAKQCKKYLAWIAAMPWWAKANATPLGNP